MYLMPLSRFLIIVTLPRSLGGISVRCHPGFTRYIIPRIGLPVWVILISITPSNTSAIAYVGNKRRAQNSMESLLFIWSLQHISRYFCGFVLIHRRGRPAVPTDNCAKRKIIITYGCQAALGICASILPPAVSGRQHIATRSSGRRLFVAGKVRGGHFKLLIRCRRFKQRIRQLFFINFRHLLASDLFPAFIEGNYS